MKRKSVSIPAELEKHSSADIIHNALYIWTNNRKQKHIKLPKYLVKLIDRRVETMVSYQIHNKVSEIKKILGL